MIPPFSPSAGAIPDTTGSCDVDDLNGIDLTGSSVSLDLNSQMDPLLFSSKKAPSSPIPKLDLGEPLMLNTNSSAPNDYLVLDTSKQTPLQVYPTTQPTASSAQFLSSPQKPNSSAMFVPSSSTLQPQPQAPSQLQIQPQNSNQLQLQPQSSFLQPQSTSQFQLQPPAQPSSQLQIQPQNPNQLQIQPQNPNQLQLQPSSSFQIQTPSQSILPSQLQPSMQSQPPLQPSLQSMRSLQPMSSLNGVSGLQSEVQVADGLGFDGVQSPSWLPNFDLEQPAELPADLDNSELLR